MLLSQTWKALQRSKARIPSSVVVLRLKLSRGFCSDDFAETWRVMIRCYYKLIVEVPAYIMTKFQGNRIRNNEVIWVLREAYSASFISIESP